MIARSLPVHSTGTISSPPPPHQTTHPTLAESAGNCRLEATPVLPAAESESGTAMEATSHGVPSRGSCRYGRCRGSRSCGSRCWPRSSCSRRSCSATWWPFTRTSQVRSTARLWHRRRGCRRGDHPRRHPGRSDAARHASKRGDSASATVSAIATPASPERAEKYWGNQDAVASTHPVCRFFCAERSNERGRSGVTLQRSTQRGRSWLRKRGTRLD